MMLTPPFTTQGCRKITGLAALLAAASGLAFAGCSSWSTYPPVETKAAQAVSRPTIEPVPTLMAIAIDYARDHYTQGQELPINLPAGTNWEVYDSVFGKLARGGKPMTSDGQPAIHINEVRTRAFESQVDVVYPRPDGLNQLVTLTLESEVFKDWRVTATRPWQIRNVEAPTANYIPPTAEQLVKEKKEVGPGGERVTLETNADPR